MGVFETLLLLGGSVVAIAAIGFVAYRGFSGKVKTAPSASLLVGAASQPIAGAGIGAAESPPSVPEVETTASQIEESPAIVSSAIPTYSMVSSAPPSPYDEESKRLDEDGRQEVTETNVSIPEAPPVMPAEIPRLVENTQPLEQIEVPIPVEAAREPQPEVEAPPPFDGESSTFALTSTSMPTDTTAVTNLVNPTEGATPVLIIPAPAKLRRPRPSRKKLAASSPLGTQPAVRRRRSSRKSVAPVSSSPASVPIVTASQTPVEETVATPPSEQTGTE